MKNWSKADWLNSPILSIFSKKAQKWGADQVFFVLSGKANADCNEIIWQETQYHWNRQAITTEN